MPSADRGAVWIVDLGLAGKVRPCLVLSVPTDPQDRVLVTVAAHTTSAQGTRFEVDVKAPFLKPGVFDAQQVLTVPQAKLVRKLGSEAGPVGAGRGGCAPLAGTVKLWRRAEQVAADGGRMTALRGPPSPQRPPLLNLCFQGS